MRITNWTGRTISMVMLSGVLATTGTVFGEEKDQVLAGPKADAPTTQPDKDHHRGFSGDHKPGERRGPGGGPHEEMKRLFDSLNLSEDQKTKVHEIMDPLRDEMDKWRDSHKDEMEKLREEGKAARESGDKEKIKAVQVKRQAIFKTMPKPDGAFEKVAKVLNDEQRTKFKEGIEKMKEHREQMMKNMREGNGPGGKGPDGKGPEGGRRRHRGEGDDKKPEENVKVPPAPAPAD
ncbi:MAG: Spy/CpxP family protein refolding chaperone [Planctomycetes bacterium]|nr:Spy/CpxP family protein refolding chaperone [Planctomycetota bacterium]